MGKQKTLHLGCAHSSGDIRIRKKECMTLYKAGYEVVFLTAEQSLRDEDRNGTSQDGITVIGGDYDTRGVLITRDAFSFLKYRLKNKQKIIDLILNEKPDFLHIHELELMYVVKKVRKHLPGIKVIFDVHEDYPGSYYDVFDTNTNALLAGIARWFVTGRLEKYLGMSDAVITVTPSLLRSLQKSSKNANVSLVCNYPLLRDLPLNEVDPGRNNRVCYCGLLTENRGIGCLIRNADRIKAEIHIAGPISEKYRRELHDQYDWDHNNQIKYYGVITQDEVWKLNRSSSIGLCCLKKTNNYFTSYPTKVFEYMMAGIPVVCSDFPVWREIIDGAKCGILVDPDDEDSIVNAINSLLENPHLTKQLGISGRRAVEEKYNWEKEAEKLLKIYSELVC